MPATHQMLELVGPSHALVVALVVGGAAAIAGPATPLAPPATRPTPPTRAPPEPSAATCAQAMPSDGHGGCYATVEIMGVVAEPVNSIIDHYQLSVTGTSREATVTARDFRSWRINDRFVAQLRAAGPATRAPDTSTAAGCRCGAQDGARLDVVGLLPLDPEDARTVAQITATAPDLWSPGDQRWNVRPPQRELWVVGVNRDRQWDVSWSDLRHGPSELSRLGPVPTAAEVGSVYVFVGAHDEPTHLLRIVTPHDAWLQGRVPL